MLPRADGWGWLLQSLQEQVQGMQFKDRKLSAVKLPKKITPEQACKCARFITANLDQDKAADYRRLLEYDDDGMTKQAGLPATSLVLCRYCYGGGGVCRETQRAHHLKTGRGKKDHDDAAAASATSGVGDQSAAARAARKREWHGQRVDRAVVGGAPAPVRLAALEALDAWTQGGSPEL
eukprot:COSAG06_NODE_4968_length_3823_cov_6.464017_2_plen_179_part_00